MSTKTILARTTIDDTEYKLIVEDWGTDVQAVLLLKIHNYVTDLGVLAAVISKVLGRN